MLELSALAGLSRAFQDQLGHPGDGHEARVLQIAIGKLHVKTLLDLCDELDDFHRSEPSGLEVIDGQQRFARLVAGRFFANLCPAHEPVCKPLLYLCSQLFPSLTLLFTSSLFNGHAADGRSVTS